MSPVLLLAGLSGPAGILAQSLDGALHVAPNEPQAEASAPSLPIAGGPASLTIDLGPLPLDGPIAPSVGQPGPPIVGVHRPVPREYADDLIPRIDWSGSDGGIRTAAFEVRSRDASSVRVRVAADLPPGAAIVTSQPDGSGARDPWTGADVASGVADGVWLPAVEGDAVRVEIRLPPGASETASRLWLRLVAHRFNAEQMRSLRDERPPAREGPWTSSEPPVAPRHAWRHGPLKCLGRHVGACDRWNNELAKYASAVGHYHYEKTGGSYLCTGTLINDGKAQGGKSSVPLFLTAAHCVSTPSEARSVDLAFDWVSTSCNRDGTFKRLARPATLLATAPEFDQTLIRLGDWPDRNKALGGRYYLGWNAGEISSGTRATTLSHPAGVAMAYTSSSVQGVSTKPVYVSDYGYVHRVVQTLAVDGMTEGGSSGAALVKDGSRGQIIGVLSHGPAGHWFTQVCLGLRPATAGYGSFRAFFPRVSRWLSSDVGPVTPLAYSRPIPFLPRHSDALHGFVRVSSLSSAAGRLRIYAIDDTGLQHGPAELAIGPFASLHFQSQHLEHGGRGFPGWGPPSAPGAHWRLRVESDVLVDARGYVRTADGFLTSVSQGVESIVDESRGARIYAVPFLNPGSNTSMRSFLRVTNHGAVETTVLLLARDDKGRGDYVRFGVTPGRTRQFSSQELERHLFDGQGKWKLTAQTSPEVPLTLLSLLQTRTGHVTNVSR